MKNTILFIITLTMSSLTYAQKAKVLIVDPDIDATELEKDFEVQRPAKPHNVLPDKDLRDEVLSVVKTVQGWDELKKDILFMDLKSKDLKQLTEKYPELKESELKGLQDRR